MTLYKTLLFVHIMGAMVWVGGTIMLSFISSKIQRSGDVELRAKFATAAGVVGPIIGVSAVLLLASGIWMVLDSDAIELSQIWVWLGLAGFLLSAIVGATFFGPASVKIVKALQEGQLEEADRRANQFNKVARFDLLLLIAIVGLMVFKPGA
jgi:uncharacterized membrane protein